MDITRRNFLETAAALSALAAKTSRVAAQGGAPLKKGVLVSMLPKELPLLDRLILARDAGFEGLEAQTTADPKLAEEMHEAARKVGLPIHSVMNMDHWRFPLSSDNPEEVQKSVAGMETSLRNAQLWGADCVLLVPGVVNPKTPYKAAWERSQKVIRERLLPLAQELKIVIGIEEVWNKFILSPMEMAAYVDSFSSPWVRAYFDVGNCLFYGYPQDWIRTLGQRIVKVHLKDFLMDRKESRYYWKNIGEGEIDWPEVRKSLAEIRYSGFITVEISGGDAAYLKDVTARLDRFLAGQPPVAKPA